MAIRIVLGGAIVLAGLGLAGWRLLWLGRLVRSGAPAPGRTDGALRRLGAELTEVLGQRSCSNAGGPGSRTPWCSGAS